ncbi:MAG: hypothetical protein EYC70_16705 [Planctomycetota bacterium]|nr:MAG: hypothetical protein EYC70_16705 [Planctomycetota bacterium]
MLRRLFHGLLLGALLIGLAGLVETARVLRDYPYHRDPGTWLQALPLYLGAGAVLGLVAAVLLPWITRRKEREAYPGLFLGIAIGVAAATLVYLLRLHFTRLAGVPFFSAPSLLPTVLALAVALGVYLALYWLARGSYGWMLASFFSPALAAAGVVLLVLAAFVGTLLPVQKAPLSVAAAPVPAPGAPNVLLIVLDTVAASHLSTYGYYRATSPELSTIASEGVVFESAFSAAPWTLTSHASLFTGLQWSTHRTGWEHPRLDDGLERFGEHALSDFHTLPEELGKRGYDTCCIAEKSWITADAGLTQGFHKVWDFTRPDAAQRTFLGGLWAKFAPRLKLLRRPPPPDKGAQRVVDQALTWLGGGRGRSAERPFFLFLNLNEAHGPYDPPDATAGAFLPDGVTLEMARALNQSDEHTRAFECGKRELEPRELEILKALYDAEILYQDQQLGRLFQGLRDLGLMEDTLVIVTSDHGQEFGLHGRLGHQFALVDELVHVPLVMRYPETLPAGTRVPHMASLVDVFPTVTQFVERVTGAPGARTPELDALEGVSLLDCIGDGAAPARDMVICEYDNPMPHLQTYPCWDAQEPDAFPLLKYARRIQALRTQSLKYEKYGDSAERLIDLKRNPDELEPQDTAADPAEEARLRQRLERQLNAFQARRLVLDNPMSKARSMSRSGITSVAAQIEQLGYTGDLDAAGGAEPAALQALVPPPFVEIRAPVPVKKD